MIQTFTESPASGAVALALEASKIPYFPTTPFALPSADDLRFFREELPTKLTRKNVSLYPNGSLKGVDDPQVRSRVKGVLEQRMKTIVGFLEAVAPTLTRNMTVGTSSFRPIEEKGRNLSAHASNELIHVDAGAYGATHGARILRVFTNVNETAPRVWASKGSFADVLRRAGPAAGLTVPLALNQSPFGAMYSALCRGLGKVTGLATGSVDSSPYDRAMRRLHNYMKDTPAFQSDPTGHFEFAFPPFSSWMVFTDGVSHACLSGQFAFIDTFIIPLENCTKPEWTPFSMLSTGRTEQMA